MQTHGQHNRQRHAGSIGSSSFPSRVFPGTRIEDGCSVGAMSIITKSTEPFSVYLGIPARRIKSRKKKFLIFEKLIFKKK
jgi:serine acetyltransferase